MALKHGARRSPLDIPASERFKLLDASPKLRPISAFRRHKQPCSLKYFKYVKPRPIQVPEELQQLDSFQVSRRAERLFGQWFSHSLKQ